MTKNYHICKIVALSNPKVDLSILLKDHLGLECFQSSNKYITGLDPYTDKPYEYKGESYKLVFHDLATTERFRHIFARFIQGAKAFVIAFDYTLPDILLQLERWFFEAILNNGNIPLILIGLNHSKKIDPTIISDIASFIEDKTNTWDLTVRLINIAQEKLKKTILYDILLSDVSSRMQNPKLVLLQKGSLDNLKLLIVTDPDIHYIYHILSSLSRSMKTSAKELVYSITPSFFIDLLHSQEQLAEIPKMLGVFYTTDLPFAKNIFKKLKYEKLFALIEQETELHICEHLFYESSLIDMKLSNKLLTKIPSELFILKICKAWIKVTIAASKNFGVISQLVSSVDSEDKKSSEIISYLSEAIAVKDKKETFQNIGKLLATILKIEKNVALKLIEDTPNHVQELALQKLNEITEQSETETEVMKTSLEAGEVSKKEAAKQEILFGLCEIDLISICIKHSSQADVLKLLDTITYDMLSLKIEEEKQLSVINQLLVNINAIDSKVTNILLSVILDSLYEKTNIEQSIVVIREVLELIQKVDTNKFTKFIKKFSLDFFVRKMLTHFDELDLDAIDVPFLVNFAAFYGRERYYAISQMIQNRYPDILYDSLKDLPEMLFQLLEKSKAEGEISIFDAEKHIMMIYNLFIAAKIDELELLINFLLEPLEITKAIVSEVFLKQFSEEDISQFSHEKKKLYDYILKLPQKQSATEDHQNDFSE